ncbi:hypothetical protein KP509_1Z327100 [Ceratopteris richardii]|nr:hypothetical protein KP509_1Z327100 [Ceratopteris richardii]
MCSMMSSKKLSPTKVSLINSLLLTLQQDGIVERKNKILVEIMCSMMSSKKLSPKFLFDAVYTSNHILNRSSRKALKVIIMVSLM